MNRSFDTEGLSRVALNAGGSGRRCRWLVLLLVALPCVAMAAHPSLAEQADVLAEAGVEHPAPALAALQQLQRERPRSVAERRLLLQAIGQVQARIGHSVEAGEVATELLALAAEDSPGHAQAAATMVRAQIAETAGQLDVAAALAESALPVFLTGCAMGAEAAPTPAASDACDYRWAWRALKILESRALSKGVTVTAGAHAQTALRLAEAADDVRRQVINLGALSLYAQSRGERDAAVWLMAQARRLDARSNDPGTHARLSVAEARMLAAQGDSPSAVRALHDALIQARLADAPRVQAQILTNLGDEYSNMHRPADALRAGEQALAIVNRYNDSRAELVLINNIGIAKIGVGRIAEGKRDMARVQALLQRGGEVGYQAGTLREFGEALAQAGDARGALEIYHRERALSAELMRVDRETALKDLQARNDADARQRDIELLGRDNALKTAALANRDLLQRLWWLLAAVMLLAIVLVTLLYRRVRETHRRLAASHVQLQAQSERDPLTNLANRRHFQAVMAQLAGQGGFDGALLLVDLDHFKSVNDVHGHSAGDAVLVEVAKRLNESVRSGDLVVRWGGEEFLILAPRAAPEQADQMAARVLRALGDRPIAAGGVALRVTASIGYARFPLAPYTPQVPWEQAVNLTDMALYTAKNQGRNRAVGITSTTAATPEALRDAEADFDRAWHEGRLTLLVTPGPAATREAALVAA